MKTPGFLKNYWVPEVSGQQLNPHPLHFLPLVGHGDALLEAASPFQPEHQWGFRPTQRNSDDCTAGLPGRRLRLASKRWAVRRLPHRRSLLLSGWLPAPNLYGRLPDRVSAVQTWIKKWKPRNEPAPWLTFKWLNEPPKQAGARIPRRHEMQKEQDCRASPAQARAGCPH